LDNAAELPARVNLEQAKDIGPWGMFWAMGSKEVKEGMGVLLELTKGLAALKG
jgi:uncharacterized protein YjgD (DUF1641 family)